MLTEQQIQEIREHLEKSKNPLFFFDDDPDGLCSYLLFKRKYQKGTGVAVKAKAGIEAEKIYFNKISKHKPDLVVFLDRPVLDQEVIDQINAPIVWLDHHKPQIREKVNYFNPMLGDKPDNRPTSYWTYKTVNNKKDMWIALIGIIGDWFIPEFLKDFEYKELINNKKTPPEILFESEFGKLVKIFAFTLKGESNETNKCIKILEKIQDPYEIIHQKTKDGKFIYKKFEKINKEYEGLLRDALKRKTDSDIFLFIYTEKKHSLTSILSNELLHRLDNKMIIIGREKGDEIRMSLRSKKVKVLPILEKALRDVRGYGGGHCLTQDSLIQLSNGDTIEIKDVLGNEKVIGMDLNKNKTIKCKIHKKFKLTKDLIYDIKAGPYSIKSSGDHILFKFTDKIKEVKAKNLRIGDLIVGLIRLNIRGVKQKVPDLKKEKEHILATYNKYKNIKLPKYLNNNFSKIFGYILGDGNIFGHDTIEIRDRDLKLIKHYKRLIKKTFGIDGKIRKIKNKRAFGYRVHSSLLAKLFEKINGGWPYYKNVPSLFKKARLNEITHFLKGVYDAEGCVADHEIVVSQSNDRFLVEVQLLLLRLGIISSKRGVCINISDYDSIKLFYEKINFSLNRKKVKLKNLLKKLIKQKRNSKSGYGIISSKELINLLKNKDLKVRDYFEHPERPITLSNLNNIQNATRINIKGINSDFALFKIKKIKKVYGKKMLYDINVPKMKNFIANGLLVHNSYACGANIHKDDFPRFINIIEEELKSS